MKILAFGAVCCALFATNSFAHIALEEPTAVAGSNYKAVFRVGHGCNGSPTTRLTVFIPDGVTNAKPQPRFPWQLDIVTGTMSERGTRIVWSGSRLPDSEYDEFVISMSLPRSPGTLDFRVLQQCEEGLNDWSELPDANHPLPAHPPARLQVLPASTTDAMPMTHRHH